MGTASFDLILIRHIVIKFYIYRNFWSSTDLAISRFNIKTEEYMDIYTSGYIERGANKKRLYIE